ncbi:DUF3078 domain-containing protein [Wenyingzhuangia sp. 2_MG-2023]|uniref:DUF3078 domain-containing protein n=1 Tax=Wenyingzhuangia sp. 2_MG-2023 TaxID=3062639 RepID=UPI0026E2F0EF|nr:DUF3078 domain-containing protein [Wenyingzhuangia sp. 2_MG-2023]MDO6736531.1 DUF3078 domain-containing protein [Wenyingzhuangia sp. 2_MG-2023]
MKIIFTRHLPFHSISKVNIYALLFILFVSNSSFAAHTYHQPDTVPVPQTITNIKKNIKKVFSKQKKDSLAIVKKDTIKNILKESVKTNYWTKTNKPSILFTQTSFLNWIKGGNNTIAGIASFAGDYNYKKGQLFWKNGVLIKYGLSKENDLDHSLKTDDIIDIKSAVGYKKNIESKWYYSGDFNLTTQIAKGYNDKLKTTVISNFFAPARMRLGVGAVYNDDEDNFKLNISPLTNQVTFVYDQDLADKGSYGVTPAEKDSDGNIIKKGENIYSEFGTLVTVEYQTTVMKNIKFQLKSSFYSDYLNRFGNVDSDVQINLNMKVNQYIQSTISSHLLYDDDAKILQDDGTQTGPKIQLKQILGVGVTYIF